MSDRDLLPDRSPLLTGQPSAPDDLPGTVDALGRPIDPSSYERDPVKRWEQRHDQNGDEVDPPALKFSRVADVQMPDGKPGEVLVQVWTDGTFTVCTRRRGGTITTWGPGVTMTEAR